MLGTRSAWASIFGLRRDQDFSEGYQSFNVAMAGLLVVSLVPVLAGE